MAKNLSTELEKRNRVREILLCASERAKDPFLKDWLWNDEEGTWEQMVLKWLESTKGRASQFGMSVSQVDDEIATHILCVALQARIDSLRKSTKKVRRRKRP